MVESKYGISIDAGHVLIPWLFRHAGDIITRCRIDHTGRTPYEKLKGKQSGVRMLPFGEIVHFQPVFHSRDRVGDKLRPNYIYGVYVGRCVC